MPAFQTPLLTGKRKFEDVDDNSRKRQALHAVQTSNQIDQYWSAQWRYPQQRKHKTWEGDAILVVVGSRVTMYDTDGKSIGTGSIQLPLSEGKAFTLGGRELELERQIPQQEYLSGACFGKCLPSVQNPPTDRILSKQFVPLKMKTLQQDGHRPDRIPPQQTSDEPEVVMSDDLSHNCVTESHWAATWRKSNNSKKSGAWTGDAFVSRVGSKLIIVSDDGKSMRSTVWRGDQLHCGYRFTIGSKEFELANEVSFSQLPNSDPEGSSAPEDPSAVPSAIKKFVPLTSHVVPRKKAIGPLHDPHAAGSVLMKAPTKDHMKRFNKKDLPVVQVVLDPIIASRLRPHQVEGVKFMYECVMGLRKHEGQGCILADEMGLGKTLQTIALVWTLLKQNPYASSHPVVERVLIVCPVSLVENWKAEFHKWLGRDRIGVTVYQDKNSVKTFINAYVKPGTWTLATSFNRKRQQALILGYERLRIVIEDLAACVPPIGLIVCDEGHRLKSAGSKTTAAFNPLRTARRIILSGTPIQNDLSEFHAMAQFCNPGLLDEYSTFKRVYEIPILRSRTPGCSSKEKELGEMRSTQLMELARSFVLRREADILGNYLPPKHEYVVFVTPTSIQLSIFSKLLHPEELSDLEHRPHAESLAMMTLLTKVSNSPILLQATLDKQDSSGAAKRGAVSEAVKFLPTSAKIEDISLSGKLIALSKLLKVIREHTEEKCVLVSHYTSTLNILEAYCNKMGYSYYRLDGSTPAVKRQEYVNLFNKSSHRSAFLFLLSSKAGGTGINLIGASRLCLVDSDWNPSHDLQSMARCHRDGQKRPVYIYRFLTAGAIDEKIFQRQVTKMGLSESLMGSTSHSSDSFSRKDLQDIFRVDPAAVCNTHELLECSCDASSSKHLSTEVSSRTGSDSDDDDDNEFQDGFVVASSINPMKSSKNEKEYLRKRKEQLAVLGQWRHINCLRVAFRDDIQDSMLRRIFYENPAPTTEIPDTSSHLDAVDVEAIEWTVRDVPGGTVSFLFEKSSALQAGHV